MKYTKHLIAMLIMVVFIAGCGSGISQNEAESLAKQKLETVMRSQIESSYNTCLLQKKTTCETLRNRDLADVPSMLALISTSSTQQNGVWYVKLSVKDPSSGQSLSINAEVRSRDNVVLQMPSGII